MNSTEINYEVSILSARAEREARLRANERGWLALAGLFGLSKGQNRFGCAPDNDIILPAESSPARAGVFHFDGEQVRLEVEPGAIILHKDEAVTSLLMQDDHAENPDTISLGALTLLVIRRGENYYIRMWDKNSPNRANFGGLKHYPVNEGFRVEASFMPYEPPKPITVMDVVGDVYETTCPGRVVFNLDGQVLRLDVDGLDDEGLFFNFRDETNKDETYPGGRFLATGPLLDGKVILDFNDAYNPPCAYTDFATCPTPLPQNHLPVRVEAGEKRTREH